MPPITFPNQRMVRVHREPAKSDFLGIKNENWQAASRDLGAHALQLYLYLASNANNYTVALSPWRSDKPSVWLALHTMTSSINS